MAPLIIGHCCSCWAEEGGETGCQADRLSTVNL